MSSSPAHFGADRPICHQASILAASRAAAGSQPGGVGDGTNSTTSAPISRHRDSVVTVRTTSIVCRHDSPSGCGVPVLGMIDGIEAVDVDRQIDLACPAAERVEDFGPLLVQCDGRRRS